MKDVKEVKKVKKVKKKVMKEGTTCTKSNPQATPCSKREGVEGRKGEWQRSRMEGRVRARAREKGGEGNKCCYSIRVPSPPSLFASITAFHPTPPPPLSPHKHLYNFLAPSHSVLLYSRTPCLFLELFVQIAEAFDHKFKASVTNVGRVRMPFVQDKDGEHRLGVFYAELVMAK